MMLTRCAISGRDLQSVDFIRYPWHSRCRYHLFQTTRRDIRLDKASGAETPVLGRQMLQRNDKHLFTLPQEEQNSRKIAHLGEISVILQDDEVTNVECPKEIQQTIAKNVGEGLEEKRVWIETIGTLACRRKINNVKDKGKKKICRESISGLEICLETKNE
ncbi:hypothetical protein HNY73_021265 [Argiope bruennichi]|uniref:Uncharacterized protein n=1 Tax=Argiope bruennichi TaxID=94029 RepID=A0A8T0EAD4_ARGBR|nr:hypothetical protein HNY73_021265 [Argiope bruennichi]